MPLKLADIDVALYYDLLLLRFGSIQFSPAWFNAELWTEAPEDAQKYMEAFQ